MISFFLNLEIHFKLIMLNLKYFKYGKIEVE